MFDIIKTRILQGYRTAKYPKVPPSLPDRFKGFPRIDIARCVTDCKQCLEVCPVNAINRNNAETVLDIGKCIFCCKCEKACTKQAISFTSDYHMSSRARNDLLQNGTTTSLKASPLDQKRLRLFGRSIRLRQVSAGGCGACEADVNVLNTLVFDLSRFGIQFVASPRHADGLLITGPVTKNMVFALNNTFEATPSPKVVIAVGACAISGGMFAQNKEVHKGADELLPVDLYIPGCPPHPYTILDGLLSLLGRG